MTKLITVITPCFSEEQSIVECYAVVGTIFEQKRPGFRSLLLLGGREGGFFTMIGRKR